MELTKLLALGSLLLAATGVLLFTLFPPSSPELSFLLAAGVAFVILLLLAVSEAPEEKAEEVGKTAEERAPEVPREEVVSRLKGALEEPKLAEPKLEAEKAEPDLLSWLRQVSPAGWKEVGEGGVREEALLGRPGTGAEGFFRLWEGEGGKRLALYTLLFPSPEDARAGFQEMLGKLGEWIYESRPGEARFHLEEMDGAIWRKEGVMALLLLGKAEKGEASRFLKSLPEALRPS